MARNSKQQKKGFTDALLTAAIVAGCEVATMQCHERLAIGLLTTATLLAATIPTFAVVHVFTD
ncbi:MAG: hypothetical protein ABR881_03470 [Candidatus Sulfotelmatobacter sp.]